MNSTIFKGKLKAKGYTLKEVGDRWGLKERQRYRIQANPKQVHIDALNGLPKKKGN